MSINDNFLERGARLKAERNRLKLTQPEKDYMRIHAAKNRTTISNVIRQAVANELSKIADPENPFFIAKK